MEKDLSVLKKKLSTYKSDGGRLKNVDDDLLLEILFNWEEWTGTAKSFHSALGSTHKQMGPLIGRAKKLKREGATQSDFKPLAIINPTSTSSSTKSPIVINWEPGKTIKFYCVSHLIEFLHRYKELRPQDPAQAEAA